MEPEYKSIIDQRRSLLVERIVWSKSFSEKLRRASILPRPMLDELERDLNHSNRTYVLLARLVTRSDQTVYQRFCDVLSSTGQVALANILLQDRDNVVWDFDAGQRIKSLDDYFNAIHESLLLRMHDLEDGYIRGAVTDEVRRRVTRLSRFLLDEMKEHEHFRSNVLALVGLGEADLRVDIVRSDLQKRPYLLFDDALENARKKNIAITQRLTHHIYSLEQEGKQLVDALAQGHGMLDLSKKKIVELEKVAEKKGDSAFLYLQKVIMEQDDSIAKLRTQIRSYEDLINIPRGDLIELLSSIRNTCPRANSLPMPRFTDPTCDIIPTHQPEVCPGEALRRHVKALIDFSEQQKLRTVQSSTKIAELERERGTMKTLLNARGAAALPAILSQQLKSFREQKFEMSNTIKELRNQLQETNKTKKEIEQKLQEVNLLVNMDADNGEERRTGARMPRARRIKSAKGRRIRRVSSSGPPLDRPGLISRAEQENGGGLPPGEDTNNNSGGEKIDGQRLQQLQQQAVSRQTLISQFINMQQNGQTAPQPS